MSIWCGEVLYRVEKQPNITKNEQQVKIDLPYF